MDDLVSKTVLIATIEKEAGMNIPEWLRNTIMNAPPARSKTGKWIPHKSIFGGLGERVYTCDQCGYNIGFHTENFCPECGAKMQRGEQDGDKRRKDENRNQ